MTFSISDVVPVIGQNDQRCQSSDKYVRLPSLKRYAVDVSATARYLDVRIVRHVDGYNSFFLFFFFFFFFFSHIRVNRHYYFSVDKRYSFGIVACLSSIAVHLEHGQTRVIKFF